MNNPRIYPGVNVASSQMNAGGVTLSFSDKRATPSGVRGGGEERRLPPDKSGGYSQDTPDGVRIKN
ncbi:MAG: hypothetical protein LBP72_02630, partial [Dysgonamonadaceae bacterium]|nr:hypothetical protein [Dysgonamonadaceae bacterium]